jgi:hypothetical protein
MRKELILIGWWPRLLKNNSSILGKLMPERDKN